MNAVVMNSTCVNKWKNKWLATGKEKERKRIDSRVLLGNILEEEPFDSTNKKSIRYGTGRWWAERVIFFLCWEKWIIL